jgi:hypothetical protein
MSQTDWVYVYATVSTITSTVQTIAIAYIAARWRKDNGNGHAK